MKVMHIIYGLGAGGAETLVKEYALKLDKSLFNVVILCFNHVENSIYEKLLSDNNIRVIYVSDYMKYYNKKNVLFRIINKIERYILIKKIIKKEEPDIIHSHLTINSYIKFSKPKKGTKIFHSVHNDANILWNFKNMHSRVDFKAAKWLVKKYKMRFIVLHDNMQKDVNKLFNVDNSIVLNNGIDFNRFNIANIDKEKIRREIGIPSRSFVIGHIGRFCDYQKNQSFLVKIFNEIHKMNDKAFLLMIGDGKDKKNIEEILHNLNLEKKYLILSNREDIPQLLGAMDTFVFPSIFEGLGIVLIEAQKMNLRCFISDKIPKTAIISNLVSILSLELSENNWANKILNYSMPKEIKFNDKDWNINEVVKKLERIYLDKEKEN